MISSLKYYEAAIHSTAIYGNLTNDIFNLTNPAKKNKRRMGKMQNPCGNLQKSLIHIPDNRVPGRRAFQSQFPICHPCKLMLFEDF